MSVSLDNLEPIDVRPIKRALISVYDKTGLEDLARALGEAGVEIVSTGSTAARIAAAGVAVTPVDDVTGFPEVLEGRVKTLHPFIHSGILADQRKAAHREQIAQLGIRAFDLVVCNLYPFADTVASGASFDECVEQIDIGGPSMVRAAAKNHPSVAVVTSPERYADVAEAAAGEGFTLEQRRELAAEAFAHTATYDLAIAGWFADELDLEDVRETLDEAAETHLDASDAAFLESLGYQTEEDYVVEIPEGEGQASGMPVFVADAFERVAIGATAAEAHKKAHACDPVSAFGGVIAVNRPVSVELARQIVPIFTEVVLAPDYEEGALEVLSAKKNLRVLQVEPPARGSYEFKQISGGLLVQERDDIDAPGDSPENWTLAAGAPADEATLADLEFAWRTVRAVRSNAILLVKDGASVGVGMGQVNRVDSCKLAVERANTLGSRSTGDAAASNVDSAGGARASEVVAEAPEQRSIGAVAASDAFFPFADGLQVLIDAGVKAVVQPGGSVRDQESIDAANAAGITMYLTGTRHFAH